ncbi:hypothetical protein RS3R2_24350 [Pseudomonas lactis]|nr:hypothetical protein RS3R2_24350 [Pseudomonas lactis]
MAIIEMANEGVSRITCCMPAIVPTAKRKSAMTTIPSIARPCVATKVWEKRRIKIAAPSAPPINTASLIARSTGFKESERPSANRWSISGAVTGIIAIEQSAVTNDMEGSSPSILATAAFPLAGGAATAMAIARDSS